jgi:hypothetical protein
MTITVTPTDIDVPIIPEDQKSVEESAEHVKAVFKTAEFMRDAGLQIVPTEAERQESREIFQGVEGPRKTPSSSGVAMHLKALISRYDEQVIESSIQARAYILNRLLEISDPEGDAKVGEQLRALELMGKVSEIGMFMERVEVSINTKTTEDIESELVATLTKYMGNAVVVDNAKDTVLGVDLDEELGRLPAPEQPQAPT